MTKPNLNVLLPGDVLDNLIPSFDAIFGLHESVGIYDSEGILYYGAVSQNRSCDVWATIWIEHEGVGRVGVYLDADNPVIARAVDHLGITLSQVATEHWRRFQLSEEVLERYDELNLIYGLGTNFVQGLSINAIVQNVLEDTNAILQAEAGAIYLWDKGKSTIQPVSFFGAKSTSDFWDGRMREQALSTLYAYEQAQLFESDKIICAPLRYNDQLLGALVLLYERDGRSFKANDVNLLTTMMQNTALFIYAAQLLESLTQRKVELETTLNELQAMKDKLSQAERLSIVGQTVATLVHDMRKPLNNVMGYAGLLQEPDLTPQERHDFAGGIVKYVEAFSSMMQEILDYVAGDMALVKRPVIVGDYMVQVGEHLSPPGLERPVKIHVDCDAAKDYTIEIDAHRMLRVFQNLVNNASDAIEASGVGSKIEITAEPDGKMIQFMITDDGPGVPPEIVDTLFDPFVTMGKSHGTGLGLAIVSRMMEMHGGKIHYENAPDGRGARFVFTIPIYRPSGR